MLVSPYLTLPTAQHIIGAADPASSMVLTTFDAQTFAQGGSSLGAIRRIMDAGFKVHALRGLHAKVVLAGDVTLVGSQNFTAGGTLNKEATAVIYNRVIAARLRADLAAWLAAAEGITPEMLTDMEQQVRRLLKLARQLAAEAEEADRAVRQAERERQERRRREQLAREARERAEREARQREEREQAEGAIRRAVRRASVIGQPLRMRLMQTYDEEGDLLSPTLRAPPSRSLLEWAGESGRHRLVKRQRYLVVVPETGRIGWCAWNATQVSRFGTACTFSGVQWDNQTWRVTIEFNQEDSSLSSWNTKFLIRRADKQITLIAKTLFTFPGFHVNDVSGTALKAEDNLELNVKLLLLRDDLENCESYLHNTLSHHLLSPFRYARNSIGARADHFTAGLPEAPYLRLHPLGDKFYFSLQSN